MLFIILMILILLIIEYINWNKCPVCHCVVTKKDSNNEIGAR
jgi:hypothetical protein